MVVDVTPTRGTHTFQRRARAGELYTSLYATDDSRSQSRAQPLPDRTLARPKADRTAPTPIESLVTQDRDA
jgi:hypothetical protein